MPALAEIDLCTGVAVITGAPVTLAVGYARASCRVTASRKLALVQRRALFAAATQAGAGVTCILKGARVSIVAPSSIGEEFIGTFTCFRIAEAWSVTGTYIRAFYR